MKDKVSKILLVVFFILEVIAIVLYIMKEINTKVFFYSVMSFSMMIGLYFYNKNKNNNVA